MSGAGNTMSKLYVCVHDSGKKSAAFFKKTLLMQLCVYKSTYAATYSHNNREAWKMIFTTGSFDEQLQEDVSEIMQLLLSSVF